MCVQESLCVCEREWEWVTSISLSARQKNCTRQQIPAASVADKLQGLAGTSGAQVALSIQDRAHWSVVWAGAGANSWTLALSAPHQGGGRKAEAGERLAGYKWRHPQTLLDLRLCAYHTVRQLNSPITTAWGSWEGSCQSNTSIINIYKSINLSSDRNVYWQMTSVCICPIESR